MILVIATEIFTDISFLITISYDFKIMLLVSITLMKPLYMYIVNYVSFRSFKSLKCMYIFLI